MIRWTRRKDVKAEWKMVSLRRRHVEARGRTDDERVKLWRRTRKDEMEGKMRCDEGDGKKVGVGDGEDGAVKCIGNGKE